MHTHSPKLKISAKHFLHFSSNGLFVFNLIVFAILLSTVRRWTFVLSAVFLGHLVVLPFDKRKSEWTWPSLISMAIITIAISIGYILIFKMYFYFAILIAEILVTIFLALFLKRKRILY